MTYPPALQESPVRFLCQEILICCRRVRLPSPVFLGLFVAQLVKNLPACGDLSMTPGFGRSPGEGKGCPLQYSCLPNSMDPIVYRVAKIWTRLKDLSLHFQEISPESRLDWSLPMPSGISSLKPTKNQKLAFAGSPLSPLHTHAHTHTKTPHGSTSSQTSRWTHRQTASLQSQVEIRDHSKSQCSQNLGLAMPSFSSQCFCPDGSRKVTNRPWLTSRSSHCCRLILLAPPLPAEPELLFPLIAA